MPEAMAKLIWDSSIPEFSRISKKSSVTPFRRASRLPVMEVSRTPIFFRPEARTSRPSVM